MFFQCAAWVALAGLVGRGGAQVGHAWEPSEGRRGGAGARAVRVGTASEKSVVLGGRGQEGQAGLFVG